MCTKTENFEIWTSYPAILTGISTEKTADDYNVSFKFLAYNGHIFKEFFLEYKEIMTEEVYIFKRACETLSGKFHDCISSDFTADEIEKIRNNFDLNNLIGTHASVSVIDRIQKPKVEFPLFDAISENDLNEYFDFPFKFDIKKDFDEKFPKIFSREAVPEAINNFAKKILFDSSIERPQIWDFEDDEF